ncbi:hypothetical protein [Neptunomonas japonica]|nr:hypothetical protein [Neptunomonas japonica]
MNIQESEQYEELATEWQYQMIILLKNALAKHGINQDQTKEIIGEFAFDFAMWHDQEEIKQEGKSYNPRISFDDLSGNIHISSEKKPS